VRGTIPSLFGVSSKVSVPQNRQPPSIVRAAVQSDRTSARKAEFDCAVSAR